EFRRVLFRSLQFVSQLLFVVGVGEQVLHSLETGFGRCLEAIQEVVLVKQHGQVGGKFWHSATPFFKSAISPSARWRWGRQYPLRPGIRTLSHCAVRCPWQCW